MTTDYLEDLLRSLDPGFNDPAQANLTHEDEVWLIVTRSLEEARPRRRVHRYELVGSVGTAVTATAVLIATLGGTTTSALAATLHAAASADSHAARLPRLAAGKFYYQDSQVSLTCNVTSPSMPAGDAPITYIANGTMQSWTTVGGAGKVVLTPSRINGNGSHFATAEDEARWVAAGEPFIPCALINQSNQLGGNPANADHDGSLGGYSSTVSGYGGFGLSLAMTSETTLLSSATSINDLPSSPAAISSLLANGQINPNGSVSVSPQACPIQDESTSASVGCTPSEQLEVMEQLIQLPDASAKLGSALYQVLANLPGATLLGPVTTEGVAGAAVSVPQGDNEAFEVVLNSTTGALISCSELLTQNGVTSSIATVTYGSVQVVDGSGSTPASASNS